MPSRAGVEMQARSRRDPAATRSGDALAAYLREIGRPPLLRREEEAALVRRWRAGDRDALDALICANLRFVVAIAKRYQHQGVPLPDLVSEGNLGLIRAAHRFDESRGIKFISYAVWWVRQAILQALAEQSRIVRVPLHQAESLYRLGRRTRALFQELGRPPTPAEIASVIASSELEVEQSLSLSCFPMSLDAPAYLGADGSLGELLAEERESGPDDTLDREALAGLMRGLLATLGEREARVLRLYYGFDGRDPLTLEQIGRLYGLTRERVRQIKESALDRLRKDGRFPLLAAWRASGARVRVSASPRLTAADRRGSARHGRLTAKR